MRKPQSSVTKTIAQAMIFILLLSVTTAGVTFFTLFSSLNDAGAINIAGSLRMQSYRLAYDIETNSQQFSLHLIDYENSINSTYLKAVNSRIMPQPLIESYQNLMTRWHDLQPALRSYNKREYLENVSEFVQQIDLFVSELQKFSELKLKLLAFLYGTSFILTLLIAAYTIFYTQRKVVFPLTQLVAASKQIKNGHFRINLTGEMKNELGILADAFIHMASDLEKLYSNLEQKVQEKTRKLERTNTSLQTLYGCSQELSASYLHEDNFRNILQRLIKTEDITAIKLTAEDRIWTLEVGQPSSSINWDQKVLSLDGEILGYLEWQSSLPGQDSELISNVAQILSRGIYYNRAQKLTQQLLLMEERTTIARELHDSIAQSLSYLKIQTTLLNRSLAKPDIPQAQETAEEISHQLNITYTQHGSELVPEESVINPAFLSCLHGSEHQKQEVRHYRDFSKLPARQ